MLLNKQAFKQEVTLSRSARIEAWDSDEMKYNKYKTLQHSRHDLIHIIACEALQQKAVTGVVAISSLLPNYDFGELSKKSPDIIHVTPRHISIIDVCVTHNPSRDIDVKMEKYVPLTKCINDRTSEVIIIALLPDLSNFFIQFKKIEHLASFNIMLLYDELRPGFTDVCERLAFFRQNIPEALFDKDTEFNTFRCEFLDPSTYKKISKSVNPGLCSIDELGKLTYVQAMDEVRKLYMDEDVTAGLKDKCHDQT
eukprot:TRINITY_DN6299_c0_g1_i1.p2 TRINITY_DN6299_c0_g1~~TRINITY_DN6299_c0_g1_i1.p2  ORF type:complete len:266 (+),score=-41.11 TRINITY_DN6299_c0_g1_i1:41-799(+)